MAPTNKQVASKYDVVISVEWNGGTRRYADRTFTAPNVAGAPIGIEGRVVSISSLNLAVDTVSDTATVTLDNTGFGGDTPVESQWSDAHPAEGTKVEVSYLFNDDDWEDRIILLYGQISEISGQTDREVSIIIHGVDATLPQQINVEINATDFPDAPRASIGRMQPFVFGTVERMEGIPVTTIARTQTTFPILSADTTISVGDVSQLPASGTVLIGGTEQVTYSGISGNDLTGCGRGANGTTAADFGTGIDVVEVGQLDILFAGHDITSFGDVWGVSGSRIALLASSLYTTHLTQPAYVRFATGWPTIPVPSGALVPTQVQMDAPTSADNAINSEGACGNSVNWSPKSHATVKDDGAHYYSAVKRTLPVVPAGDIVRVWAVFEYDASTVPISPAGAVDVELAYGGGAPQVLGNLDTNGTAPTAWIDLMGLTSLTAYNGGHDHNVPGSTTQETCYRGSAGGAGTTIYQNGGAGFWTNEANLHDASQATKGTSGTPSIAYEIAWKKFAIAAPGQAGRTVIRVRAHCKLGTTGTVNAASRATLQLFILGQGVKTSTPLPVNTASVAAADFSTQWYPTNVWADVDNTWVKVQMNGGLGAEIYEAWLEVEWAATASVTSQVDPIIYGAPAVFDVTQYWLSSTSNPGHGTWDWFTNGTTALVCQASTGGGATTNIIRMYFVCAVSPFKPTPCDRILADVAGVAPAGLPTDVLLAALDFCGLHLKRNAADFATAAAILGSSSVNFRQDFAQYDPISGAALLQMICDEARLRCFWEQGLLCVVYLPDLASLPVAGSLWSDQDLKDELMPLARTPIADVYTLLNATYKYDGFIRADAKALVSVQTVALSTRRQSMSFKTIADDHSALLLANSKVERAAKPRYQIQPCFFLSGLSIRRGSIVQITAGRRTYSRVEAGPATVQDGYVTITCIVWDTI